MTWSNDPEMQKMFIDEVTERSERLVDGAQALRAGTVTPQEAGDLLREGHTIKGTGRVMGYDDVGSAGLMLEMIWRWIQQGDITPAPIFGRVLEALSSAIPAALDDPAELSDAMAAVHEFFEGQDLPDELPPAPQIEGSAPAAPQHEDVPGEMFAEAPAVEEPSHSPAIADFAMEPAAEDVEPAVTEEESPSDVAVAGPVVSAHDAFAQLADAGDEAVEVAVSDEVVAGPVVSAHDAFAQLADAGDEAVEVAVSDEVVAGPVVSAHDAFAQLADAGDEAGEPEPLVDGAPESPVLAVVEDERASAVADVDDPTDEEVAEAARSAQDAFAELRRSMMQEDAVVTIAAEPEDDAGADAGGDVEEDLPFSIVGSVESTGAGPDDDAEAPAVVDVEADAGGDVEEDLPFSILGRVESTAGESEDTVEGEPQIGADEHESRETETDSEEPPIGALIEFPIFEGEGVDAPDTVDAPHTEAGDGAASDDDPGVVALPSSKRPTPRTAMDSDDLGGLVKAVQTWAAEEAIAVNTGRLYELVNHIVSLRMDVEAVKDQLAEFSEVAAADPFFSDRVSNIAQGVEPVSAASELIETKALALAAAPLKDVTNTLPQLGRYLSRKTGKELRVEIVGDDILVDRQVLDRLGDAMRQLVVNSAVHGIEDVDTRLGAGKSGTGSIRIEAKQSDVNLELAVVDDGRGIDWRAIREKGLSQGLLDESAELAPDALRSLLYQTGFTTRDEADELAGDGDGLAVVREAMESLNGSLRVESTPKEETRITLVVPVHQAMQKALLVKTGGIIWGIPETGVVDIVEMNLATIAVADHTTVLERVDGDVPFASFADLMGLSSDAVPASIVVATSAAGPVALGVEEIIGVRRVAAKELGAVLADAQAEEVTGAALLGGEQVVLLVDPTRLAERQREVAIEAPAFPSARILIVDDSVGVQQVVSSALATSGFNTSVAASVADALGSLHSGSIDAVVVDFSMPRADGVALAHMVRQRHGDLPIIMLSGVAEGDDVERAREAGVDAFFNKADFREGGLAEKLRELITIRREKEQTA